MDTLVSEWFTIDEASGYLSKRTLYRWMDSGELPYFFIAAGAVPRRIRRRDLENLMEEMD